MPKLTRREAIRSAAALGAALAWPSLLAAKPRASSLKWTERRDLFPQGVASGDPFPDGVVLWTRRPPVEQSAAAKLQLEIAEDEAFRRVVSTASVAVTAETDWTARVLAAGLESAKVYYYRFTDEHGFGSRIGRTITAPAETDGRPVRFTFVSCQNVAQGACNAYRRMIFDDERKPEAERLGFVLHLGDFIYEVNWYPEDRQQGMYDRRLRDLVRFPHGEKFQDFHVPASLEDYRTLYRAYLGDPDLQDGRARWPFVCVWDNHEFSWKGWQSQQNFGGVRPAQTRKAAANQAWFEYQPARAIHAGPHPDRFPTPQVADAPIRSFDEQGLGQEAGNLAAIESLKIFRSLRYGRNVDLLLTDNRSFRSEPAADRPEAAPFDPKPYQYFAAQEVIEALDAGRTHNGGKPPETLRFRDQDVPNPRRTAPPQSMLGAKQKAWFLDRLRSSKATWKLWGNSVGMLDLRVDLQNLPADFAPRWPSPGYGLMAADDWSAYRTERNEILDLVRTEKIVGLATLAGDRHAFFAGLLSTALPPRAFHPVGVEFITGSISAPGVFEAVKHKVPKADPLRPLYLYDPADGGAPQDALNVSVLHGANASLVLQKTGDKEKAKAARNPEQAPHLQFADAGGHGYALVEAGPEDLKVEFVCIPRPLERSDRPDGGPLTYRVVHRVQRWEAGTEPKVERVKVEGELPILV